MSSHALTTSSYIWPTGNFTNLIVTSVTLCKRDVISSNIERHSRMNSTRLWWSLVETHLTWACSTDASFNTRGKTWHSNIISTVRARRVSTSLLFLSMLSQRSLKMHPILHKWATWFIWYWRESFHLLIWQSVHWDMFVFIRCQFP